jgi:hypothetical protein
MLLMAVLMPAVCAGQNTAAQPDAVAPAISGAAANVINCGTFASRDASLDLVSKLCEFALNYRHQLPDFIARQTTTSHGPRSTVIMTAQVTYHGGLEHYSQLTVNGKLVAPHARVPVDVHLLTNGEFGPLLINLFEVPDAIEFKLSKTVTLSGAPAVVFDFHLPKKKNTFWALRAPTGQVIKPEFRGQLWLEPQTGHLLREELEPVVNEPETWIASAKLSTDYAMTAISDLGAFLLPVRSESRMCMGGWQSNIGCTTNIAVFSDYQKFVATSRILPGTSQP